MEFRADGAHFGGCNLFHAQTCLFGVGFEGGMSGAFLTGFQHRGILSGQWSVVSE
ncbi:MAG: hypothetical protein II828_03135 [Clostridia bacterium]|nr:hypothetical protein [Clostridia bacterium]